MNVLKQARFALPLILFVLIFILLWRGLSLHPAHVPSPLINKPAPSFELPTLQDSKKMTSNKDFLGHVTLLNVWATWCYACAQEHLFLVELAKNENIVIYGFNYKDDPKAANKWLTEYGNPFKIVAVDQQGKVAIDWGVYGTPETFVIDKKGIIRYKLIGELTSRVWDENLKSLVVKLRDEPA